MKTPVQHYSIQETSQKCGVPKSTLRFWEKRFGGLVSPARSQGGQRRYSVDQLAVISKIHHLKRQGLSLDEIGAKISSETLEGSTAPDASIERLGERIAALVRFEVSRFLDDALQVEPTDPASARTGGERRG